MQPVKVVKGKSMLETIDNFDVIAGCPVDYMHCVLLGVIRRLLKVWFAKSYHNSDW